MTGERRKPGTFSAVIRAANPVFIVIAMGLPLGALFYALVFGPLTSLNYVHIMTGALWTGIDLFMGFILGPVLGGMDPKDRAAVFRRLVPKMTFFMPAIATVATVSGIELAKRLGMFSLSNPKMLAALIIAGILTAQGFGLLLPNEIRVFKQLLSERPDVQKISQLGMMNAKLGGLQGIFQLAIIFVMASIRF